VFNEQKTVVDNFYEPGAVIPGRVSWFDPIRGVGIIRANCVEKSYVFAHPYVISLCDVTANQYRFIPYQY
jgi:hypothetical protein